MFSTTNTVQLFILLFTIRHSVCLEFIEYTNNQTKYIGEDARFNCTFNVTQNGYMMILGASYWDYKLPNNDTFLLIGIATQEHNFTLLEEGGSLGPSAFIVKEVSHEFHGLAIRCTHLPLTHTAYLFVYSEPKLNINDTYFEVIEHQIDSLFVRFSTDGYPDPIYSKRFDWFHNGELLTGTNSITLTSVSLRLTDPLRTHTGSYSLTTYTERWNATAGFFINVTYPPEIKGVEITDSGLSRSVRQEFSLVGDYTSLSCGGDIEGNPPPVIVWEKQLSHKTSLTIPSNTDMLFLNNISLSDTGLYYCVISNPLGSISIQINLTVYGPPFYHIWVDVISIGAISVVLAWEISTDIPYGLTYGLVVDYYELVVTVTIDSSILVQQQIDGKYTNYSISYQNGITIYPDTQYTADISAYTYNDSLQGQLSSPFQFQTLQSTPILQSVSSYINLAGIVIQWVLYSSGKNDSSVNFYIIKYRNEYSTNSTILANVTDTTYTLKQFDSHTTYYFYVFGFRNGLSGESIETQIDTMGYGVPPTPLLINTSNTGLENTTNVFIKFTQVSTPYVEFKIFIFCQQQINSSQKQIITLSNSKLNFFGGNLNLSLSPTNIYSSYNCSLELSNIFANSTFRFVFNGSSYGVTDRTTKSENTNITPQPNTTPHPNTTFHVSIKNTTTTPHPNTTYHISINNTTTTPQPNTTFHISINNTTTTPQPNTTFHISINNTTTTPQPNTTFHISINNTLTTPQPNTTFHISINNTTTTPQPNTTFHISINNTTNTPQPNTTFHISIKNTTTTPQPNTTFHISIKNTTTTPQPNTTFHISIKNTTTTPQPNTTFHISIKNTTTTPQPNTTFHISINNTTTTPVPNTAFHILIIVVIILLIIISLVLTIIIVKITSLCLKRSSYSVIKTEKLGELESKIGDQSFETTFIAGVELTDSNLCETTSV